jgi:hypothetical protein
MSKNVQDCIGTEFETDQNFIFMTFLLLLSGTLQLARFHSKTVALRIAVDLDGTPLPVYRG